MKIRSVVVFFTAIFCGDSLASCWPDNKLSAMAAYMANAAVVADWGQTRHIANNPDKFMETNPDLGRHPTVEEVDRYFVARLAYLNGIGCGLGLMGFDDGLLQGLFWGTRMVITIDVVSDNHQIGIRMDF